MRALCAWIAAAGVLLAGCSSDGSSTEPDRPATSDGFDSAVAAVEERIGAYDDLTTGVIALVRVGEQTRVIVSGDARLHPRTEMEPELRFPVASITKSMTAAVIMQLVEDGRLALDDQVGRWVPELRDVEQPITIKQLLAHQAGLGEATDAEWRRWRTDSSQLLRAVARHPLLFKPGAGGSYSNEGYLALGLVAERVLGRPFGEILRSRVFDPTGMGSSSLLGSWDVRGYDDGVDVSEQFFTTWIPPAGGVVATVGDVDAFYRALWSGQLVDTDAVRRMRKLRGYVGEFSDYGLGLAGERFSCGHATGHSGRLRGISTEAWTLDDGDRSTVVLVNDQLSDVPRILVDAALCD